MYHLTDEEYEFIKGEVIFLFEKYDVRCIPIDAFELATKIGIILIPYSSLTLEKRKAAEKVSNDGFFCELKDGKEAIYYNNTLGYARVNMTILHEIGHCVLDHYEGSEKEEAEAKFFAKYAAAPPPLIHRIKPKTAADIAEAFDLSYEAAGYALNYYHKWLNYGGSEYTEYEKRLLRQFETPEEVM